MRKILNPLLAATLASCQAQPEDSAPMMQTIPIEEIAQRCLTNSVKTDGPVISRSRVASFITPASFQQKADHKPDASTKITTGSDHNYTSTFVKHKNKSVGYDLDYQRRVYKINPEQVVPLIVDEIGAKPTMLIRLANVYGCDNPSYMLSYSYNDPISYTDAYSDNRCIIAPKCVDYSISCRPSNNKSDYFQISIYYQHRTKVTIVDFVPIQTMDIVPYILDACRPVSVDPFNR